MTRVEMLVIGDVMTDVIVRPAGPPIRGTDRAAVIRTLPGGSGANVAAWLARQGVAVALAARVGSADVAAQAAALRGAGVAPFLAADPDVPTGTLVTLLDPDGERSFLTDRGANKRLSRTDLPDTTLAVCRLLHVSAYSLFEPGARDSVLAFVALARTLGVAVAFDAASTGFLRDVGAKQFLQWTRGADILFANADEAALLAGTTDSRTQLDVLAPMFGVVVIKRGAAGAEVARGGERWRAPAPNVGSIDSSGAGDAFAAGFLASWLRGDDLPDCLDAGNAVGARAVTQLGGQPTDDPSVAVPPLAPPSRREGKTPSPLEGEGRSEG